MSTERGGGHQLCTERRAHFLCEGLQLQAQLFLALLRAALGLDLLGRERRRRCRLLILVLLLSSVLLALLPRCRRAFLLIFRVNVRQQHP